MLIGLRNILDLRNIFNKFSCYQIRFVSFNYIQIMKNKFRLGILLGFLIPTILFVAVGYSILNNAINQEDLNYESSLQFVDGKTINEKHQNVIVIILSSGCPANEGTVPVLKENLEKFKENNINYILIADELYDENVENHLNDFKKKYGIEDEIFLMDKNRYPENSGIFNTKRRYVEFVNELTNTQHRISDLGYVNYILLKEGKYLTSFGSELSEEDYEYLLIE